MIAHTTSLPIVEMIAKATNTDAVGWFEVPSKMRTNGVNWLYKNPSLMLAALFILDQDQVEIHLSDRPGESTQVASFSIDLEAYKA
jgi:hypothetical protein